MMLRIPAAVLSLVMTLAALTAAGAGAPPELDHSNVVWTTPSADASGSMPIGNGRMGANVWIEPSGELVVLLSRTDSFSEASRLLKLGRVRVKIEPNPVVVGASAAFRQELVLRDGRIEIAAGVKGKQTRLQVCVDPDHDVLHVMGESDAPVRVSATLENWRTERRVLKGEELSSSWTMRGAPESVEVAESADVVVKGEAGKAPCVVSYHRNADSVVPLTIEHQGMKAHSVSIPDPLAGRVFGGSLALQGDGAACEAVSNTSLRLTADVKSFQVTVATHAKRAAVEDWQRELAAAAAKSGDPSAVMKRSREWWNTFWDRSWVFVDGDRSEAGVGGLTVPVNEHPLRIGEDSEGKNRFAGQRGRTCIYPRPLTAEQAKQASLAGPHAQPRVLGVLPSWMDEQGAAPGPRFKKAVVSESRGFTLESWIRPLAGSSGRIFDKLTAGQADGFLLDMHPGMSLRLIVGDRTITAKDCLKADEWQHVLTTVDPDAGRAAIYLNGSIVAEFGPKWKDAAPPSRITQGYVLQRWMTACMGRGEYPIKFNGGIFTVEPGLTGGGYSALNPDWRKWGDCYWWQNTRLPYAPMLASGDFEMIDPLFRFIETIAPVCRARAKAYYGAEGLYFPETVTMFGMYSNGDYGWKREGLESGDISPCPWWQWAWNQGPELVMLMLDYHDFTGDERFARERLVPIARDVMRYFDSRFKRDERGKLLITPTQAVETYWHDVVNDTPCVAGLRATLPRLLALGEEVVGGEDRALFKRLLEATPELPLRAAAGDGPRSILPAEKYKDERSNVENPELYAVWPFRLFGVGKPDLEIGRETFHRRVEKSMLGWSYDGQCAAMLGLTDEAKKQLLVKVANGNPAHRFPAMWGPNYDWLPDQCHGGNVMLTLQTMLLQCDGPSGKLHVLPAWPREWDVSFKLHAPGGGGGGTVVECEYRAGKIERLEVAPSERRRDVVLPPELQGNQ